MGNSAIPSNGSGCAADVSSTPASTPTSAIASAASVGSAVSTPGLTARAVNGIDGILQVFEYFLEDSLLFALGSEQALHVFHNEDWRSVPGDNAEVLPIKEVTSVGVICLAAKLAYQFGAAHKRVGLAGGLK